MTSESGSSERRWLAQPPGSEDVVFQFGSGDEAEVTPEVQAALANLVQALRGDEVHGFIYDPKCTKRTLDCTVNGTCQSEFQHPTCAADYHCQIGKLM